MVSKGKFITAANPWVSQFRVILVTGILVAAFLLMLGCVIGSWALAIFAVACMLGLGGLWFQPGRMIREVRIYENGLERSMAGKLQNNRIFLPWSAVEEYRWEGDVLRFKWSEHAFLLFRGNEPASSQRLDGVKAGLINDLLHLSYQVFPSEVQVPAVTMSTIQKLLTRAGQR